MNIITFRRRLKKTYLSLYNFVFSKKLLKEENSKLKYQLEYMKCHFDITQMKPATGWLREYQLKLAEFAKEWFDLFEQQGLHPFLGGGALLGGIRHGGFIPYDDDIDVCAIRSDYQKIEEYCKKNFFWYDTRDYKGQTSKKVDELLKTHPNQTLCWKTPYCLHIYRGTCLRDSVSIDFFPYDYVKEDVTEEDFAAYRQYVLTNIDFRRKWGSIFDSYEKEWQKDKIFSKTPTTKLTPGLGNYSFIAYSFYGFENYEDVFPLKKIQFESYSFACPNNCENFLKKLYSDLGYPEDVGISHGIKSFNEYLETIGESMNIQEF